MHKHMSALVFKKIYFIKGERALLVWRLQFANTCFITFCSYNLYLCFWCWWLILCYYFFEDSFIFCECLALYVSVSHVCSARRGQKRGIRHLELELQNPGFFVRTESALYCCDSAPAPPRENVGGFIFVHLFALLFVFFSGALLFSPGLELTG